MNTSSDKKIQIISTCQDYYFDGDRLVSEQYVVDACFYDNASPSDFDDAVAVKAPKSRQLENGRGGEHEHYIIDGVLWSYEEISSVQSILNAHSRKIPRDAVVVDFYTKEELDELRRDQEFYMNPNTGSVDTLENWKDDQEADPEEFPLSDLDELVKVVKDKSGEWVDAE